MGGLASKNNPKTLQATGPRLNSSQRNKITETNTNPLQGGPVSRTGLNSSQGNRVAGTSTNPLQGALVSRTGLTPSQGGQVRSQGQVNILQGESWTQEPAWSLYRAKSLR